MEEDLHHVPGNGVSAIGMANNAVNVAKSEQSLHSFAVNGGHPVSVLSQIMQPELSQRQQGQVSPEAQVGPPFYGEVVANAPQLLPSADNGSLNKWTPSSSSNLNTNGVGVGAGHHTDYNGNPIMKNAFPMMLNSSHMINDPSIQESLSPFFQPFGIDVNHLPLTNPPIFQSALSSYDEPVRRRRISISNGQINQLSEDLETLENLYNTQPPPLPQRMDSHPAQLLSQQGKAQLFENGNPSVQTQTQTQSNEQSRSHSLSNTNIKPVRDNVMSSANEPTQPQIPPMAFDHVTANINTNKSDEYAQEQPSQSIVMEPTSTPSKRSSSSSSGSSGSNRMQEPIPGTNAWKRARLLERNRMAASKCRQRKKIAQLQLQRDYDLISKENKIMKRKLDYYEKLVTKFKRFSEAHLKKCSGSGDSLEIIEEMLMIDSGIQEVDDSGLVVKLEES